MIPADGDDYTLASDPQDTLDGTGPQPEPYGTGPSYAYTIRGETITAVQCAPRTHIYDVATFPERLDADIAALREELATLRDRIDDLADTVVVLVNLTTMDHMPAMAISGRYGVTMDEGEV